jgi:hypothetical protein
LTELVRIKFNLPRGQAEQLMWLALDELEKANLLQDKVATTQPPRPATLTRRQVLTAFAGAGLSLALLPIVSGVRVTQAPESTTTTTEPTTVPPTEPPTEPTTTTTTEPTTTTTEPTTTTTEPTTTTTTTAPPAFPFTGFFPPVDNPPIVNVAKAGSAIPVKFSLGGYRGMNIFAAGYPASVRVDCSSSAPVDTIEETTTNSGLTYDASSDQYHYNWKTEKGWGGTCRQLTLRLSDGTNHVANFKFK